MPRFCPPAVVTHTTHPMPTPESSSDHRPTSRGKNDEISEEGRNAQGYSSADNHGEDNMTRERGSHRSVGWCDPSHGPGNREEAERGREKRVVKNQGHHLNANYLGFFVSIKSRVWGKGHSTIDDLIQGAEIIFEAYDADA